MAFTPGYNPEKQARVAREATNQGQVEGPLPLLSSGGAPAVVEFDWSNPSFALRDRQARAAVIAGNFDQVQGFTAGTMPAPAATTLPPGVQSFDLAPRAPARLREYTHIQPVPLNLLGQDAVNPGKQSFDLTPRAASRARDYSITQAFPLELIGQDAMATGAQSVDLPPRAAPRLRDYTIAASFPLELIGQDAMLVGEQSLDIPPRAASRLRDYSITEGYTLELIGQDATLVGKQLSGPAPAGAPRAAQLYETGVNLAVYLTALPPVIPCGQSTGASELPPRAYPRLRDYTVAASFPLELIGKDQLFGAAGQTRAFDWTNPGRGAPRAAQLYEPGVNGALWLTTAASTSLPPGLQSADLPPRAPLRSREYGQQTWYALELIGKDNLPPGRSTIVTEGPPRGPLRLRDYTHLNLLSLELYGQDAMYGRPGEVPAYDWQMALPPRAPARMRDYSWLQTFGYGEGIVVPPRNLTYTIGQAQSRWKAAGRAAGRWIIGTGAADSHSGG